MRTYIADLDSDAKQVRFPLAEEIMQFVRHEKLGD